MLALSLAIAGTCALAAGLATGAVLRVLRRRAILDLPNERSSHSVATPRGGGIAVVGVIAVAWTALAVPAGDASPLIVLALALVLAVLSWFDDLGGLPVVLRFGAHIVAVALGLATLPDDARVLQGLLPFWPDRAFALLAWVWFLNLFNFMDGIDGISGAETAGIGVGLVLVATAAGGGAAPALLAAALAGAAIGFLWWNWHPARIFLGDVGSVPLGFLLGWLLLQTAAAGSWAAALLLPLYYLADATVTLARRAARGERVWQAHRSHFYQQAARRLGSHAAVVIRLIILNAGLIALAMAATAVPALAAPAAIAGAAATAVLLWYFADKPGDAAG